jgi:hypothetical protein
VNRSAGPAGDDARRVSASARRLAHTRRLSTQWLKRLRVSAHTDSTALIREDREAISAFVLDASVIIKR